MHTTKDVASIPGGPFRASVTPAVLLQLRAHARRESPGECCGMLLGRMIENAAEIRSVRPAVNTATDASSRFIIPGHTVLAGQRSAERDGLDVIGFYHSHPRGDARPSPSDADGAPAGYLHLIIGAEHVRAWRRARPGSPLEEVSL